MNKLPESISDLKAGYVLADLPEKVTLDKEFEYIGFAFWKDEKMQFFITNHEQELYDELEQKVKAGIVITSVQKILRRLMVTEQECDQVILSIQTELKENLINAFPISYFKNLAYFSRIPGQSTAYSVLAEYVENVNENLTFNRWRAFRGLVRMAILAKKLNEAEGHMMLKRTYKTEFADGDKNIMPPVVKTCLVDF